MLAAERLSKVLLELTHKEMEILGSLTSGLDPFILSCHHVGHG